MRFTLRFAGLGFPGRKRKFRRFHTGLAEWMTAEGPPVAPANLVEF
jgi:hypothetical protein